MPPKKSTTTKAAAKPAAKTGAASKTSTGKSASGPGKKTATPAAGGKKAAPAKGKDVPAETKPKTKVWTKQDDAARVIQTRIRGFLAKKELARRKKKKQDYEEMMENLEKEALIKYVKIQQEVMEKERQKEEEERRRKKEEAKRKKRMLEAAFDGDIDEMNLILNEVVDADDKKGVGRDDIGRAIRTRHLMDVIECEDANGNTPLSEASSGGNCPAVKMLIEKGADPNTVGQFRRSPLYRAAFAGHLDACEMLLQHGADPRVYADDGQTPEQIATGEPIKQLMSEWDMSQTEVLLSKIQAEKDRRAEEARKKRLAEMSNLETQLEEAQKDHEIKQKQLQQTYIEYNRRISEHDTAMATGFDKPEITLQAIKDAEVELEVIKLEEEESRNKLAQLKLRLREKQMDEKVLAGEESLPGVKVLVRELDDVLFRDVGNKIKDSGKWPLLIDPSAQAATFLRYRDTNYINALRPRDVEPETIRMALLGALRYGKPLVMDMMEVDMFDTVSQRFDEVMKGLMDSIMDRSLLIGDKFLSLVKSTDGEQYSKKNAMFYRMDKFQFYIITKNPYPSETLIDKTYVIRVHIPTDSL